MTVSSAWLLYLVTVAHHRPSGKKVTDSINKSPGSMHPCEKYLPTCEICTIYWTEYFFYEIFLKNLYWTHVYDYSIKNMLAEYLTWKTQLIPSYQMLPLHQAHETLILWNFMVNWTMLQSLKFQWQMNNAIFHAEKLLKSVTTTEHLPIKSERE